MPKTAPVLHLQLLSRKHCCLCDEMKTVVDDLARSGLCTWEQIDVDRDKGLMLRYGQDVPVLMHDGKELFRHRVAPEELKQVLRQLHWELKA